MIDVFGLRNSLQGLKLDISQYIIFHEENKISFNLVKLLYLYTSDGQMR